MRKHNIARMAATAGLALTMALGPVAAPVAAFAADGTGSVTIKQNANNTSDATTTLGYQIFKADVVDNGTSKTASNITWANDEVGKVVVEQIQKLDSSYKGTTAQDAADYLSTHLPAEGSSGTSTIIESDKLYSNIANTLRDDKNLTPTTLKIGEAQNLSAGYWVFLTNSTSTDGGTNQVGSAPIYAVVGGSALTISPKTTLPTVTKQVKNDATGADWSNVADSQMGQSLQYRLIGTVVDAIPSYDTYYYKFTDTLSAGLTADSSTVAVTVETNGTSYTVPATDASHTNYTTTLATNTDGTSVLRVEFTDLKSLEDSSGTAIPVNGTTKVYVTYSAALNSSAVVANGYNDNSVTLTYSNNPGTDSKGNSTPASVRDYTFRLNLVKVDSSQQSTKLSGAKFTIQATNPDEGAGTQYVQADGTLGATAYEFETDSTGSIAVSGLDVGKYHVVETQAPNGYNTVAGFDFEIRATYDTTGALTKVEASSSNSTAADASTDTAGLVTVTVKDKAGMSLPLTGQAGVTVTWIAGGVVLALGITHLVRSRKNAEDSAE